MDEISKIQKGEALAASTNTIDGSRETTCLLCFCPLCPCFSVFLCAVFFFPLQLGQCDKKTATKLHTNTQFSLYSQRGNFITQISSLDSPGGALINSHFTPFVLSHREWEYCWSVAVHSVCLCVCVCSQADVCIIIYYSEDNAEFGMKHIH